MTDDYIPWDRFDELKRAELEHLAGRDPAAGAPPEDGLVGVALSGGGIRSAIFSLGVMQALASAGFLERVHYLSTVSGGGYLGSALTWMWHRAWPSAAGGREIRFGPSRQAFPLAARPRDPSGDAALSRQHDLLRHVRARRNYLFPGGGIGPLSMLGVLLRGILCNALVYGTLLVALLVAWRLGERELYPALAENIARLTGLPAVDHLGYGIAAAALAAFVLLKLLYTACQIPVLWSGLGVGVPYRARRWFEIGATVTLSIAAAGAVMGSLHDVWQWLGAAWRLLAASGLTLAGVALGILSYVRSSQGSGRIPLGLVAGAGAFALVFGLLLLAHGAAGRLLALAQPGGPGWLWPLAVLAALVLGLIVQLNFHTAHRYYRDRLMETFLPDVPPPTRPAARALAADDGCLKDMCRYLHGASGPYHLINTNVVLVNSRITKYAGRGGDNFLLSPLYCGSRATGWQRTAAYHPDLTLATAMATSGAAVNPHTGAGGKGPTRGYLLSVLMSLLNLRLGYWMRNPDPARASLCLFGINLLVPGWRPYCRRMNETCGHVQLTDGGHFDNLGLYELIRREVATVVVVDGTADPRYEFSDFGTLAERVRVDFGARVEIDLTRLTPSMPSERLQRAVSTHGHAVGCIRYASGRCAKLVYVTTVLPDPASGDVPEDVLAYARRHAEFPDQPTSDQFFDEEQFEAYRELGYRLGRRAAADL